MKFEKIFFILFSLLLLDACSDYVDKYEGNYKEAYGDEAIFIDNLNNFEWEWSATCETGGWLWCAAKNGKVATSQIVSLSQFVNGSVGLVFTGKDNNAYDYATNTLPQDLTPLIRRNGGVAVKVENASGAFEAGVSVNLDGINLADIEKYKSIVIAYANEYPGAYISLREVVAGEVVSEWRWKLDKGDVSTRVFAFVDLEYVKGEADLPTFLAKANAAAFVLTENAEVTKGLTIVAVGFGNMGESYISIYPVSSASTPASSTSVRVSSSSRPPNSSAAVYFNCDDPSSMTALDFSRICAVSSSSARSSSSAAVRSSSSARSSSSTAASSSSARSSSSVVAPSSGVEQSSSSEGPSFLWRGIGNKGLTDRYIVNMNIVPASDAGRWQFGDFGDKSDVIVPEESAIDTCNGVCGLIRFNESNGGTSSVELYFAVNTIEHLYYDATALGGLCITYYSDNAATLRIGPSGSATSYEYKIPSYELPAVTGTEKYMSYDIAWESFKQPSGAPKAISGAEAAEKLQFVDIMFKGKDGETQFFNIYEIGSLGQCGKAENIKVSHVDADYFKDMAYQHAQELLNPNSSWYGTYTDQRNQDYTRYYKTIETLNNTWFAQNLNYNTDGSYCYDNKEENCYLYGRLYTWEAAQNACPTGWHLMTDAEFESIRNLFESDEAASLKSTKGWYYGKNGTDNIGFAVTPGGYYDGTSFLEKGKSAYFWVKPSGSSNEVRMIESDVDFVMPDIKEGYYASVRCVKDKAKPKYENDIGVDDLIWYGGNKMNGNASYLTRNLLEEYPYVGSNAKDYIQFGSVTITDDVNITDDIINACGGAVCGTVGNIPAGEATDIYFNVYGNLSVEDWGGICLTYTSTASDGVVLYLETDDPTLAKYYTELSKKTNAQSACNAWNNFKQDGKGVKQKLDSYLPKVNAIKIQFNSAASGAKFNIVSVGKYTDGYDDYVSFLAESKDNRTSAWDYLNPDITYTTITDDRDEQEYKTVVIGDQTWMAENLNYDVEGSTCNGNCNIYGRLYKPALAATLDNQNNLCPHGWRLPTEDDFSILIHENHQLLGSPIDSSAAFLKARRGWRETSSGADGNGTDLYGFSAIAANGVQETFMGKHINGDGTGYVYNVFMILTYKSVDASVGHGGSISDGVGYPIRCIADEATGL